MLQSLPHTEPSVEGRGSSTGPLAITVSDSAPTDATNAFGSVTEGVAPLREIVDVDALPATAVAAVRPLTLPLRAPARVLLKK